MRILIVLLVLLIFLIAFASWIMFHGSPQDTYFETKGSEQDEDKSTQKKDETVKTKRKKMAPLKGSNDNVYEIGGDEEGLLNSVKKRGESGKGRIPTVGQDGTGRLQDISTIKKKHEDITAEKGSKRADVVGKNPPITSLDKHNGTD